MFPKSLQDNEEVAKQYFLKLLVQQIQSSVVFEGPEGCKNLSLDSLGIHQFKKKKTKAQKMYMLMKAELTGSVCVCVCVPPQLSVKISTLTLAASWPSAWSMEP